MSKFEYSDSDWVNLLSFLVGKEATRPHSTLFWRYNITAAVGDGDWKLIRIQGALPLLFNLATDLSEKNDGAAEHPELVSELLAKLAEWEKLFPAPRWSEGEASEKIHFQDHTGPPKYQGPLSSVVNTE